MAHQTEPNDVRMKDSMGTISAADIDLDSLSKDELKSLKASVEKAIVAVEVRRKADARRAVEETAKQYGLSLSEILTQPQPKGSKGLPKYANPFNADQTWTGRGRKPNWVVAHIEKGGDVNELAI